MGSRPIFLSPLLDCLTFDLHFVFLRHTVLFCCWYALVCAGTFARLEQARLLETQISNSAYHGASMDKHHIAIELEVTRVLNFSLLHPFFFFFLRLGFILLFVPLLHVKLRHQPGPLYAVLCGALVGAVGNAENATITILRLVMVMLLVVLLLLMMLMCFGWL